MRASALSHVLFAMAAIGAAAALPSTASANSTIIIVNIDGPNEGFSDPTPRAPIGGNSGTTVGEQRLIAFQRAADIWGATLDSVVPIRIRAAFNPLTCTATGAASLDDILSVPLVRCDQVQWSLAGISLAGFNAIFSLGGAALVTWLAVRKAGR